MILVIFRCGSLDVLCDGRCETPNRDFYHSPGITLCCHQLRPMGKWNNGPPLLRTIETSSFARENYKFNAFGDKFAIHWWRQRCVLETPAGRWNLSAQLISLQNHRRAPTATRRTDKDEWVEETRKTNSAIKHSCISSKAASSSCQNEGEIGWPTVECAELIRTCPVLRSLAHQLLMTSRSKGVEKLWRNLLAVKNRPDARIPSPTLRRYFRLRLPGFEKNGVATVLIPSVGCFSGRHTVYQHVHGAAFNVTSSSHDPTGAESCWGWFSLARIESIFPPYILTARSVRVVCFLGSIFTQQLAFRSSGWGFIHYSCFVFVCLSAHRTSQKYALNWTGGWKNVN